VGLGPDNREVSGDIEGLAARKLEKMYPAATVLLTNGACGNINPPDHKPDFKLIGSWAEGLANEIAKAVEQRRECKGDIEITRNRMDIELEVFSSQQIQKAGEILEREFAHGDKKLAERAKDCVRQWRENISKKYPPDIEAAKTSIDITAVRIGPAGFACFGAEVFSEMTTRLRAAVQENVYVVGYADGDAGYLANEKIYDEGGYEVDTSFIVYNTFRPRRGEFEKACEKAALMMSGLYRGEK
jgi:hypothetical protein